MRICVGSDHAGFPLKEIVLKCLAEMGHDVEDLGTHNTDPVDYPDYAEVVVNSVLEGKSERGVLICGSGVGASVAVNKIPGARACLCHDTYSAHQGVKHDQMNVLVLGGRVIGEALACELVRAFVNARPSQDERHLRRVSKITAIEQRYSGRMRKR